MNNDSLLDSFAGDPSLRAVKENASWKSALATLCVLASLVAITVSGAGAPEPVVAKNDPRAQVAMGSFAPASTPAP